MITFTLDSIEPMCNLLKHETFPTNTTYLLNDGIHLKLVSNFIKEEMHFEENGMTSVKVTGYKLQFESGEEINFQIKNNRLTLRDKNITAKSKKDYGIDSSVSKFMF